VGLVNYREEKKVGSALVQPMPGGVYGSFRAIGRTDLVEDAGDVVGHGPEADKQLFRNNVVALA
jgi:hypothetical protein